MPRQLPPLSTLRAFEAVARLGSVTRAAEELGRTHGAVSRQLRTLHELSGVTFFDKDGTGVRLNRHGEALRQVAGGLFDNLEQGWQRILDEASGESLHIACSATFAMRWLVPSLAGFYRDYPDLRIRLTMTSAREIRQQGADIIIAWDRSSLPAANAEHAVVLAPVHFGPICAPSYDVAIDGSRFAFETRIAHEFTTRAWSNWQELRSIETTYRSERRFPHTHLCIEAASAGLGVALVEQRMVRDELASGRLIAPFGFAAFGENLTAVPIGPRGRSRAAWIMIDWLKNSLKDQC